MTRILHLSDLHIGYHEQDKRLIETLDWAVNFHVDIAVITGDLTEHGLLEEYKALRTILDRYELSFVTVPGNHDKREFFRMPQNYLAYFPASRFPTVVSFSQECRALHFICMNSNGHFPIRKREWARGSISHREIRRMLSLLSDLHGIKIVLLHHHPIVIPQYERFLEWFMILRNAPFFMSSFFQGRGDIVLHGHKHSSMNYFHYANSIFQRNCLISCTALKDIGVSKVLEIEGNSLTLYEKSIFHIDALKVYENKNFFPDEICLEYV